MGDRAWPTDWLRGILEPCVLAILANGESWGYAIAEKLDGAGFGVIKGGTLYPLLGRLEESGLVSVEWRAGAGGPGRKYFVLTTAGRKALDGQAIAWAEFTRITQLLISDVPPHQDDFVPEGQK